MSAKQSKGRLVAPSRFTFRTPLLPLGEYLAWSSGLEAAAGASPEAVARDTDRLRERLREIVARPEIRDALFVASPDLDESLTQWLEQPDGARGQAVERTLVCYFARMAARSTPFGLFSGVSAGRVGNQMRLPVSARGECERHTRLDNDYLFALTEELRKLPEVRAKLPLRPSSSLYMTAGRLRYAEARLAGTNRSYQLVAVEPDNYLLETLRRARGGALRADLVQGLLDDDPEVERDEAEAFVDELIDCQMLANDLTPAVTGDEPIVGILRTLRDAGAADAAAGVLAGAAEAIEAIDRAGLGAAPRQYRAIAAQLSALPAPVELKRLLQVDLIKPAPDACLHTAVVNEIERGIELLRSMTPRPREDALTEFRRRFTARYEDREAPLVDVLDEESGIGFQVSNAPTAEASPLLAGLVFPGAPRAGETRWETREVFLLGKLQHLVASGGTELKLSRDDVRTLAVDDPVTLPDAFSCMATVVSRSADDVARGKFRVHVSSVFGPSGARISGRFCHASRAIDDDVREHLRAEEALEPDAVFAEIVHLPEGRMGNILCRPVLREYEIPYLGLSGAPRDRHIPVQDLLVRVVGDRVVLRSQSRNREVIPRMSTAHNYSLRTLGVYRFLCELQHQGTNGAAWQWGALGDAPFLPRVTHGKLVLSPARWLLRRDDLEPLADALKGAKKATTRDKLVAVRARVFEACAALRERRGLPRFVLLADGDNELPIDLENVLSCHAFAHNVKSRPSAELNEVFPEPDELVAEGPDGAYSHELVLSFVQEREPARRTPAPQPKARVRRTFDPGSEWVFAKLYTGTATADAVLRDVVAPVARSAIESGAADRWHFIRYGDPDWHVRVRFHGEPVRLQTEVVPVLLNAASSKLSSGQLWRVQLDTYEREVERYGGPAGIELAEELFCADSDAVLEIVELLDGDEGAEARWRLTVRGADMLLDDLGFDIEAKYRVMASARESFGREFNVPPPLQKQLGKRFREEREQLEAMLARDPGADAAHDYAPGFEALSRRSARLRSIGERMRALEAAGKLTSPFESIVWSYIHMHANRLLRSAARAQELVIYDFLKRIYESQRKRGRS